MYIITLKDHGPLTNDSEHESLRFNSVAEAEEYLSNCSELDNLDTLWTIELV